MDPVALEAECERLKNRVRKMREMRNLRATPKQIRQPIEDAAELAEKLRAVLRILPQKFFAPDYAPDLIERLESDLAALRHLAIGSPLIGDGGALATLKKQKQPDPRTQFSDAIGAAIASAYERLTGNPPTLYREPGGVRSLGTFPEFVAAIRERIGLSAGEASAIVAYRRNRYRSKYQSVRAEVGRRTVTAKRSETATPEREQQARSEIAAVLVRNSLKKKPPAQS